MKHAIEYSVGRYQIRINFWFLIIFLLMQTLLNELGFWQLERAKQKQVRIAQLKKGETTVVDSLNQISKQQIQQFQLVKLNLDLNNAYILLLDNKTNNGKPGYHVLNVAQEMTSGKNILVNRGWVFAGADRNKLPEIIFPAEKWHVKARIYPIAAKAISTASAKVERNAKILRLPVLDQLILRELEQYLGLKLENYLLRLNTDSQAALTVNWMWTNMPAEKHLAYAFQWFALALAFLIISFVVCIKKR